MIFNQNNLKLARIRVYERGINKFDVALYRTNGTTLRILFFNRQEELKSILIDNKQDLCLV